MQIRRVRQILQVYSDDTRLRIINLLNAEMLSVADICGILGKNQSNVSKHLARLRLLGIASDRRKGLNVYYYLPKTYDKVQNELCKVITVGFSELGVFKRDLKELEKHRKKAGKGE